MRAALEYGRRGLGIAAPNPAVGALVVKDDVVIGRGFTQKGGRPHAEPVALAQAGEGARGACLYVTLEPCAHHGQSPPCVDAIIASGVSRVVAALRDPDVRVAGEGFALLRAKNIEVETDVLREEALRANLGHVLRVTRGRPMVTLKLAQTADFYAAAGEHDPRLAITGPAANLRTHVLRSLHDAIMVGVGTVLADDPLMTVRIPGSERKPVRIVLDAKLELPLRARIVAGANDTPTWAIAGAGADAQREKALIAAGVDVLRCPQDARGRLDLRAALELLGARGLTRIFSEGGPRVASSLIAQGLADEVVMFTAPKPLGRPGVAALDAEAREILADAGKFNLAEDGFLGVDGFARFERRL